jgi:DNA mismatch endonuclease (patch repair protein)
MLATAWGFFIVARRGLEWTVSDREGTTKRPPGVGRWSPMTKFRRSGRNGSMADQLSKEARSALMSRIKGKNTGTERTVFRLLRRRRVYFAAHAKELPGCPDVVFRKVRLAVFIDGDFWHGRRFDELRSKVSPFWVTKIGQNMSRDRRADRGLWAKGWSVLHLWSKDVDRYPELAIERIVRARERAGLRRRNG